MKMKHENRHRRLYDKPSLWLCLGGFLLLVMLYAVVKSLQYDPSHTASERITQAYRKHKIIPARLSTLEILSILRFDFPRWPLRAWNTYYDLSGVPEGAVILSNCRDPNVSSVLRVIARDSETDEKIRNWAYYTLGLIAITEASTEQYEWFRRSLSSTNHDPMDFYNSYRVVNKKDEGYIREHKEEIATSTLSLFCGSSDPVTRFYLTKVLENLVDMYYSGATSTFWEIAESIGGKPLCEDVDQHLRMYRRTGLVPRLLEARKPQDKLGKGHSEGV